MVDCCLRRVGRRWCSNFCDNSQDFKALSVASKDSTSVPMISTGKSASQTNSHSHPKIDSLSSRCPLQIYSTRLWSHCQSKTTQMSFTQFKTIHNKPSFQFTKYQRNSWPCRSERQHRSAIFSRKYSSMMKG